jgi:hypothetical protein
MLRVARHKLCLYPKMWGGIPFNSLIAHKKSYIFSITGVKMALVLQLLHKVGVAAMQNAVVDLTLQFLAPAALKLGTPLHLEVEFYGRIHPCHVVP